MNRFMGRDKSPNTQNHLKSRIESSCLFFKTITFRNAFVLIPKIRSCKSFLTIFLSALAFGLFRVVSFAAILMTSRPQLSVAKHSLDENNVPFQHRPLDGDFFTGTTFSRVFSLLKS